MTYVLLVFISIVCWKYAGVSDAHDLWMGASVLCLFAFAGVLAYNWNTKEKKSN